MSLKEVNKLIKKYITRSDTKKARKSDGLKTTGLDSQDVEPTTLDPKDIEPTRLIDFVQKRKFTNLSDLFPTSPPSKDNDTSNEIVVHCQPTSKKNCIESLRSLFRQGLISREELTFIQSDMITHYSLGSTSNVEHAHELLVNNGDTKIKAEGNFAEQCKDIANKLKKK